MISNIILSQISFHQETEPHPDRMLNLIHRYGVRAGIALKPGTSLTNLDYILEKCDTVLLMLINPGFAQDPDEIQVPYSTRKIRELRQIIDTSGLPTLIEVDGRISLEDISKHAAEGADIFVTGSSCLEKTNIAKSVKHLLSSIK